MKKQEKETVVNHNKITQKSKPKKRDNKMGEKVRNNGGKNHSTEEKAQLRSEDRRITNEAWFKTIMGTYREDWKEYSLGHRIPEKVNYSTYIDDWGPELVRDDSDKVISGEFRIGDMLSTFHRGKLNGPSTMFYVSGAIRRKMFFKKNERHGLWTDFFENGSIFSETQHENGKMNGSFRIYYDNGQIDVEGQYVDDRREGVWSNYYSTGEKWYEESYECNEKNGPMTMWHKNGLKRARGIWKNDNESGLWAFWKDNGCKTREEYYENGVLKDVTIFDSLKRKTDNKINHSSKYDEFVKINEKDRRDPSFSRREVWCGEGTINVANLNEVLFDRDILADNRKFSGLESLEVTDETWRKIFNRIWNEINNIMEEYSLE